MNVFKKPTVALIVTGDELVEPGQNLISGKIYESNSYTLLAALKSNGFAATVHQLEDNFASTKTAIKNAIKSSDVVILTGGISVGDYDFVGKSMEDLKVEKVFYKINQKPGKPMYHGVKDGAKIFALPGNPAAALTCYYFYVLPTIQKMSGEINQGLKNKKAFLHEKYSKKGTRAFLLKAQVKNGIVSIHTGQSSAMLSSFVEANCLLHLPSQEKEYLKGDEVDVYLIPNSQ